MSSAKRRVYEVTVEYRLGRHADELKPWIEASSVRGAERGAIAFVRREVRKAHSIRATKVESVGNIDGRS